jgi:hypothetical protein
MFVRLAAVVAGLVSAVGLAAFLGQSAPQEQDRTLTGCLRGGSSAGVFILRNAGESADDYVLVAIPQSVSPAEFLNHRVAITGLVSQPNAGPPPPAGANAAERALLRLSVKALKDVAPNCSGG